MAARAAWSAAGREAAGNLITVNEQGGFTVTGTSGALSWMPEVRLVNRLEVSRAAPVAIAHAHDCLELSHVESGHLRWWVGEEWAELRAGDTFVVWPGEVHGGALGVVATSVVYTLQVDLRAAEAGFLGLPGAEGAELVSHLVRLPRRRLHTGGPCTELFQLLLAELSGCAGTMRDLRCRSLVLQVVLAVAAASDRPEEPAMSAPVAAAAAAMRGSLDRPLSLAELASRAGCSLAHLKAEFRREVGVAPGRYYTDLRLQEACRLLRGDASIVEVAHAVGFPSGQHFSTMFKKVIGFSPSVYRRLARDGTLAGDRIQDSPSPERRSGLPRGEGAPATGTLRPELGGGGRRAPAQSAS